MVRRGERIEKRERKEAKGKGKRGEEIEKKKRGEETREESRKGKGVQ